MKVAVHPNLEKKNAMECAKKACEILILDGAEVSISPRFQENFCDVDGLIFEHLEDNVSRCDFVVAIGGDGTMLRCAKKIKGYNAKLIGINTGRLGFMASLEADQLDYLKLLKKNDFDLTQRMMIHAEHHSNYSVVCKDVLNDVDISGYLSKICDFELYCDDYKIGSYRADGLLFSTPTGSTAYALSAGGPVIEPDLECIEMTLICPHTLFARPMIFSTQRVLKVNCKSVSSDRPVSVSFDGENTIFLKPNDWIEIKSSKYKIPFVDFFSKHSFHESLSNKMMRPIK